MKLLPSPRKDPILCAILSCAFLSAGYVTAQLPAHVQQIGSSAQVPPPVNTDLSPVPLEWVPPALLDLQTQAAVKSSFTLDRAMLGAAVDMMNDRDPELKQSVNKLDGVSVHLLRFGATRMADPAEVDAVRDAYHLRGWKHLVTTTDRGGPIHNGATDVWVVMDGVNMRGAVVLAETPQSLTLVTVAGNLSPIDLLHLRGHFGIPRFDGDGLRQYHDRDRR
ncbi:MAG TPA: DUF4252 domain-containing protein [Terracidiphilus sp.]|jgi:hypothetical protein|nr:DUF4252 domain-containing protein [Terracidiphilus sp.]